MKTMNRTVSVLLALTLLFSLSACSGLLPGKLTFNTGKTGAEETPVSTSTVTASGNLAEEGGTVTAKGGVSVDFTPGLNVPEGTPLTVSKQKTVTDEEIGAVYTAYDISLGDVHDLGGYVAIRIPYDDRTIEAGQDPARCVAGMYRNEESGEWEGVLYGVDAAAKELIVYTDHFSTYGCFVFRNEGKRSAKVTSINDWLIDADQSQCAKALQEILDSDGTPGLECRELLRPALEESFNALSAAIGSTDGMAGEIGNLTTLFVNGTGLGDVVGNVEWANGLTTALGYAGIATSLVNLSSQALKSNKTQNDILGMYKSTAYLLGSISQSATLGTIGASVWVVDKGLTEMGEYSYNKIAEDTTKAYRHYYSKYMARSKSDWRWALKDVARNAAKNKERADTAIMDEIDRWCGLFWEIDTKTFTDILVDVGQQGRGWPDADTKKAITSDYKGDLLKMLEPILEEVQRDLELDLWREQQKRIEEFRVKLNTAVTFEIKDTLKEGQKESAFCGYTAAFGPLSNGAVKADWQFSVNKEGWIRVQSTVIGWMLAGQPKELRLYEPGKDPELDAPDKTILFKMSVPHVLISLKTEEEIVSLGKWSIDGAPEGYPLYGIYVKGDRIADGVMVDEAMARQIFDMGGGRTFIIEEGTGDFLIPTEWRHTASDTVEKDVFRIHFLDEYHLVTSYQSGADGATMTKVSD